MRIRPSPGRDTPAAAPGTDFDPAKIADRFWQLHIQQRHEWQTEMVHGSHR